MTGLGALIRRNSKVFFKDKGMFFTSLITPLILLVLYATFLAKVYQDSFTSYMPEGFTVPKEVINGLVGGQLVSSLLAVSCVTVAFCSNLLMVLDKVSGARRDLTMGPVKSSVLSLSYFVASGVVTLIISYVAFGACLIYLYMEGWYLTGLDLVFLALDIFLLSLFGTALSSVVNCNLSTNGQASAVGTIVTAGYGFICGAYMPISNFGEGLQKVISFLPGTYGTSLLRNHAMRGVYEEMERLDLPAEIVENMKKSLDCNLYFFEKQVSIPMMYVIMVVSTVILILVYIAMNAMKKNRA